MASLPLPQLLSDLCSVNLEVPSTCRTEEGQEGGSALETLGTLSMVRCGLVINTQSYPGPVYVRPSSSALRETGLTVCQMTARLLSPETQSRDGMGGFTRD